MEQAKKGKGWAFLSSGEFIDRQRHTIFSENMKWILNSMGPLNLLVYICTICACSRCLYYLMTIIGDFLHFIVMEGHPGTVVTLCLQTAWCRIIPPLTDLASTSCSPSNVTPLSSCSRCFVPHLWHLSVPYAQRKHTTHTTHTTTRTMLVSLCAVALIISTVTSNKCTGNY